MKPITLTCLALLYCFLSISQEVEFRTNANGLMYSDSAMAKLKKMVLDQNILFKTCDLNKKFSAYPQAKVYTIHFESKNNNLKDIRQALDIGESFDQVSTTYSSFMNRVDSGDICIDLLEDEEGKRTFLCGNPNSGYSYNYIPIKNKNKIQPKTWYYEYNKADKEDKSFRLTAYWIPEPFRHNNIPHAYGQLIQYVDCMIDTNANIYLARNYTGWVDDDKKEPVKSKAIQYIEHKQLEACNENATQNLENESPIQFAKIALAKDSFLIRLIKEDVQKTLADKRADIALENLANAMDLPKEQLTLMRCRQVMGMCSQDESPRLYALEIATMAGEVQQWDIFMRAHMDILNDRFERVSDGSYAWEKRQTYLKELEELGLHVTDIMLGMTLRASNTAKNHYNGTVWRLGKALTECKDRKNFEARAIKLISDSQLDDFNRGLVLLLLNSYIHRLQDITEANALIHQIKNQNTLPSSDHISIAIAAMKEIKKDDNDNNDD